MGRHDEVRHVQVEENIAILRRLRRQNVKARTDWRDGGPAAKLAGRSLKRLQEPDDLIGSCIFFCDTEYG